MSTATRIVVGTIAITSILAVALLANLWLAA
jgi:hypothetical protein